MVTLNVDGEHVSVVTDRLINMGFSGRDEESVQEHIDELAEEGISPPESVPTTYEVSPRTVLVDPDRISVVGERTSGEAEVGLFVTGRETYVVAASDHSDRALETVNIQKAKEIAPNVVSHRAWRFTGVRDHWDELELRAWNTIDGKRERYQDATLDAILEPESVLEEVRDRCGESLDGTLILSGTIPSILEELTPGSRFEVECYDPIRDRSLTLDYHVNVI